MCPTAPERSGPFFWCGAHVALCCTFEAANCRSLAIIESRETEERRAPKDALVLLQLPRSRNWITILKITVSLALWDCGFLKSDCNIPRTSIRMSFTLAFP